MKRSPLVFLAAFLSLPLLTVVLGLWRVGWKPSALPLWFWGVAVLAGVFGVLGGWLTQQASPERPLRERTLLLGAGWGLPVGTMAVGTSFVNDPVTPVYLGLTVLWWAVVSLIFGRIMAGQQRPA